MNIAMRHLATSCVCLIGITTCEPVLADLSATELLTRYVDSINSNKHIQFDATTVSFEQGGPFDDDVWMATVRETMYINPPMWRFRRRMIGRSYWRDRWSPYDYEYERVRDGSDFLVRRAVELDTVLTEEVAAASLAMPAPEGKFVAYNRFKEDIVDDRGNIVIESVPSVLYGHFFCDGKKFVADVMRDSGVSRRVDPEHVNDVATEVIHSKGPFGTHTLWLDPAAGFLPRRIVIEKTGSDLFGNDELQPISKIPAHGREGDRRPNLAHKSCTYEIKDIQCDKVDGAWMITGYNSTFTLVYMGDVRFARRERVALENIQRNPDTAGLKLTMQIPNGTPVAIEEHTAIDCEWRDGEIVKVVDKTIVSSLADVTFQSNVTRARAWLVGANLALVVAVIVLLIRRRMIGASG